MFQNFTASGNCVERCLVSSATPGDRWIYGACMACCLNDNDGDGFITKDDLAKTYEVYCGNEEEQQKGNICYICKQLEDFI